MKTLIILALLLSLWAMDGLLFRGTLLRLILGGIRDRVVPRMPSNPTNTSEPKKTGDLIDRKSYRFGDVVPVSASECPAAPTPPESITFAAESPEPQNRYLYQWNADLPEDSGTAPGAPPSERLEITTIMRGDGDLEEIEREIPAYDPGLVDPELAAMLDAAERESDRQLREDMGENPQ